MEQLPLTALLNRLFGGVANALLNGLHIQHNAQAPISNAVAMQLLVTVILLAMFVYLRLRISVEKPGGLQHLFEGLHEFVNDQSREIIGHDSEGFTPFLVILGVYILTCNLIGLVPSLESPTGTPTVPLGCAILAFFYYNAQGVKRQGPLHYAAHFAGPMPALAPLMVPIEIISHLARVLSLTIRLFANMFAGDMVTLVFFSLVPVLLPVAFLALHIGVSILQAYIFVLLTSVYLAGAVAQEH
jgi:F-type H+-transporting ATPase subunit a